PPALARTDHLGPAMNAPGLRQPVELGSADADLAGVRIRVRPCRLVDRKVAVQDLDPSANFDPAQRIDAREVGFVHFFLHSNFASLAAWPACSGARAARGMCYGTVMDDESVPPPSLPPGTAVEL